MAVLELTIALVCGGAVAWVCRAMVQNRDTLSPVLTTAGAAVLLWALPLLDRCGGTQPPLLAALGGALIALSLWRCHRAIP